MEERELLSKDLFSNLPNFNSRGIIFRELIGDLGRIELNPIQNINDINKGAIVNSLEWHLRFQERTADSAVFSNATEWFLDEWGKLFGLPRPIGFNDDEYKGYILGTILSSMNSLPALQAIFPKPDFLILNFDQVGFTSDYSATDLDIIEPGVLGANVQSFTTFDRGGVYIFTPDLNLITQQQIEKLLRVIVAGSAVWIGEIQWQ